MLKSPIYAELGDSHAKRGGKLIRYVFSNEKVDVSCEKVSFMALLGPPIYSLLKCNNRDIIPLLAVGLTS